MCEHHQQGVSGLFEKASFKTAGGLQLPVHLMLYLVLH